MIAFREGFNVRQSSYSSTIFRPLVATFVVAATVCTFVSLCCAQSRTKDGKTIVTDAVDGLTQRGKSGKLTVLVAARQVKEKTGKSVAVMRASDEQLTLESADFAIGDVPKHGDELPIKRQFNLTVSAAKEFVDFGTRFGRKTASVPLGDEKIHVNTEAVWFNVVSNRNDGVHFGPYLSRWKRVARGYDGHYGVRLNVPW